MTYVAAADRYDRMTYSRCGSSGLKLPAVSLGLWQNFGGDRPLETRRAIARGRSTWASRTSTSRTTTGRRTARRRRRSAGCCARTSARTATSSSISTKAGYDMWPGPYGEWGSRKYLLASLDQRLPRMGLDYVDIFYSHRFDPETPLEETMGALDTAVRQGKALYVGISSYSARRRARRRAILARPRHAAADPPAVVLDVQPLDRARPARCARRARRRLHPFSPLAQGMLTDRYLDGVPSDSRAAAEQLVLAGADHRGDDGPHPRAERDRRSGAARRSRRWRSPGRCATRASRRR